MLVQLMRRCSLLLLVLLTLSACGSPPATPATSAPTAAVVAETAEAAAPTAEPTEAPTEPAVEATTEATVEAATEATAEATVAPEATAAGATTGDELIVGMVLVGPINDRGYNQAHYEAMTRVEQEVPGVRFIYVDKVNPADRPNVQVQQVVDDLAAQGARLIITNSDDFKDGTREAAEAHPDLTFLHMSGDDVLAGRNPPNLGNIMGKMEYGKMMAGCAAALQTKTGKIAYLGPLINDETRRLVNASYLGARYCWSDVLGKAPADLQFTVTWIGFWFNIPGVTLDPTKVMNDFISADYDVSISGIDTTEGLVESNKASQAGREVYAAAYDYELGCDVAPEVCIGVPYFNWFPAYKATVEAVQAGTWQPEWQWLGPDWSDINNPDTSTIGFVTGQALSEENRGRLDTFIAGLADGSINLWTGPLNFQDGTTFLDEGETATDEQIWYMPQLLEGIEGQSAPQ